MKKFLFISGHDPDAERKVDLHFMAQCLLEDGNDVSFIVVGSSFLGHAFGKSPLISTPNTWIYSGRFSKLFWYPVFHPMKVKLGQFKDISSFLFGIYPLLFPYKKLRDQGCFDYILIESGAGLALVPKLKVLYPKAKFIYSVSDRLVRLHVPRILYSFEKKALPDFDMIRVPSPLMMKDFPCHSVVRYIPHGIDRKLFDAPLPNPFLSKNNAISIGDSLFDAEAIKILATSYPEWSFHLFGEQAKLAHKLFNVIEHGETRFEDILPYIQHADVGLALYCEAPQADYISHSSLRMIQYSYCKLPIVTPHFSAHDRAHAFGYEIGNAQDLCQAFTCAKDYERESISKDTILDWTTITQMMFHD
ncbi:MAG: hypothetical protein IAE63_01805 [Alphaproteobacteria bacterium]|nr:hypothetical protein [Alphaproteobacteria bacterium]